MGEKGAKSSKKEVKSKKANSSSKDETANKTLTIIGMDCEMVGVGVDGKESMLARVSLVNGDGDCLYDEYVKPQEEVTDYRTFVSGIREEDLLDAPEFGIVKKKVAKLIKGKILVGHGLKNDFEVLSLFHPNKNIRDTSVFFKQKGRRTPSLKNLAAQHLGAKIQSSEHCSIQDAQAAVQLYNKFKEQWETTGGANASYWKHKRPFRFGMSSYSPDINDQY